MLDAGSLQSEPLALPRPIREKVVNDVLPPLPLQLPPPLSHLRAEAAPYPGICASMLIPVRKVHESRKQSQTDFELHAPCGDYGSPDGEQQQRGPPPLHPAPCLLMIPTAGRTHAHFTTLLFMQALSLMHPAAV